MKKIILLKVMSLVLLVTLAFTACSSHHDETVQTQSSTVPHHLQPQEIQKMKAYLVSQHGFKDEHLQVDEEKGLLIAEGCMLFEMEDFWKKYAPHYDSSGGHTARPPLQAHYQYDRLVNNNYRTIGLVKSSLSDPIPVDWMKAIILATDSWNALGGRFRFTANPYAQVNHVVRIYYEPLRDLSAAIANLPQFDGTPGATIRINSRVGHYSSVHTKMRIICHEIGHIIGFEHTDGKVNSPKARESNVYGCGADDVKSIMWSSETESYTEVFSECDKKIYKAMYP